MPAKAIFVPGTSLAGPDTQALSLSGVQVMPEPFKAAENAKFGAVAALRPTTPNRLGPRPFAPPFCTVWQMLQRAKTVLPLVASPAMAVVAKKANAVAVSKSCRMGISDWSSRESRAIRAHCKRKHAAGNS